MFAAFIAAGRRRGNPSKTLAITTAATASGTVGVPLAVTLAANFAVETWGLASGTNGDITGSQLSLVDTSTAGDYAFSVVATDSRGRSVTKTITLTLTGTPALAQITDLAFVSATVSSITMSFTNVTGATSHEASVGDDNNPAVLTAAKTVGLLLSDTAYDVKVRGRNATQTGPWSSVVVMTTDADVSTPPAPGITAARAARLVDSMVLQMRLNIASAGTPYTDYSGAGGWIAQYYAPMAAAGIKRIRTSFGPAQAASQPTLIIQNLNSTYGTMFDLTLNAELTDTVPPTTLIDRAATRFPSAVRSFQGLNEPNDPTDPLFSTWKDRVIDHTYVTATHIRSKSAFSSTKIISFSGWSRQQSTPLQLLYANGVSGAAYTTPSGRTWNGHCRDNIDYLNDHWYTGGRPPTVAGDTSNSVDENGDPLKEITLDANMAFMDLLKPGGVAHCMTENGWQGISSSHKTRSAGVQYLSEDARAKYYLRQLLENFMRGYEHTVAFEWFDNPSDYNRIYGFIDWTYSGGSFSYSTRKVYDAYLNFAAIMNDTAGTANSFTPGDLNYSLSGAGYDATVHHTLLQKANGKFYLPLWQERPSWSRTSPYQNITSPATKAVTVDFGQTVAQLRTVRPFNSQTYTSVGTSISSYAASVPDDPLILEITP